MWRWPSETACNCCWLGFISQWWLDQLVSFAFGFETFSTFIHKILDVRLVELHSRRTGSVMPDCGFECPPFFLISQTANVFIWFLQNNTTPPKVRGWLTIVIRRSRPPSLHPLCLGWAPQLTHRALDRVSSSYTQSQKRKPKSKESILNHRDLRDLWSHKSSFVG